MAFLRLLNRKIRLATLLLAAAPGWGQAGGAAVDEYQVKGIFLLNFAKFIEWPPQAFKGPEDPIRICVLGENSFDSVLGEALRGKPMAHRRFALIPISNAREAALCHIVFIPAGDNKRSRLMLGELKGLSILTVGETDDFLATGGIIRFKLKNARVRFEIDGDSAARANLKVSSKLMS